jgi:hypothetical protein
MTSAAPTLRSLRAIQFGTSPAIYLGTLHQVLPDHAEEAPAGPSETRLFYRS